ncbi:hypothetical protein RFI_36448 [Reticulomyxa filosa]|uniref:FAD-binding FR-type domain-containing protein n=1 Tax=Reticulomyxa filosa TaxID=46433 RepID=X6LG88_RETFI|nr:hypothetical protein RFI_36448 [Reticulomyxa filosa]|eukprot:ETO00993.1 hypothetical protein RFI_36448 [Reticulomyxa filosa]
MFELFVKMHWILFISFLYVVVKHDTFIWYDSTLNLFQLSVYFWLVDLVWCIFLIFSCNKHARLVSLKMLRGNVIKISFAKENFMYESGQYVFICIPSLDLTEWHPFSLASCQQDDNAKLCVRVLDDWTKKLQFLANKIENSFDLDRIVKEIEWPSSLKGLTDCHRSRYIIIYMWYSFEEELTLLRCKFTFFLFFFYELPFLL